jgi:hypothetical protein
MEKFHVRDLVFQSRWANYLVTKRPDVIERHFTLIKTNEVQIAMVYAGSNLVKVLTPAKRVLFWREAAVTAEIVDVIAKPIFESDDSTGGFETLLDNLIQLKTPAGVK